MVNKALDNASMMVYQGFCHPYGSDHLESWNDYTSSSYLECSKPSQAFWAPSRFDVSDDKKF